MAVAIEMNFKGATLRSVRRGDEADGPRRRALGPRRPVRSSTGSPRPTTASRSSTSWETQEQFDKFAQDRSGRTRSRSASPARPRRRTATSTISRARGRLGGAQARNRIARPHGVHEPGQALGQCRVVDLQHVLGVLLARVGEVERAEEDDVVGNRQLRVHVVVDGARAPRRRALACEARPRRRSGAAAAASTTGRLSGPTAPAPPRSASGRPRPRRSTFPSAITCASVARIGAAVITGEQIRTRRFARPIAFAIRWDSASPKPGQNHGRTSIPSTCTGRGSTLPEVSTIPVVQSSSKLRWKAWASSGESITAITFSSRDHESSVQFVEPVQTEAQVADDVLVVHQVGDPGDRLRRHAQPPDVLRGRASAAAAPGSARGNRRCRRPGRRPRAGPPPGSCHDELLEAGAELRSRRARGRASSSRAARKSWSAWAIVPGCWPPSVSVVTVIMRAWSLPTFCGAGRWCGTTPTSRSIAR